MTSECLDISLLANPALRFSYHMYGASMGTLEVSVNGTSLWSLSGDQGNVWNQAQVDLSAFAGQDITIVFTGTRGTSFTGDMALDNIEVDEGMSSGCTDPNACNYDPAASVDDGSCYNLTASASATDVSCNGGSDGTATVSANVSPVVYMWSNGSSTASISSLAPGTYSVTVEDANGCMVTDSAVVGEPAPLSASLAVGNESAAGASDGQIDLTVNGGVPCITAASLSSHNPDFLVMVQVVVTLILLITQQEMLQLQILHKVHIVILVRILAQYIQCQHHMTRQHLLGHGLRLVKQR